MIKAGSPILISKQDLLSYVSQEDMAMKYITGFEKVGKPFKSEFRNEAVASSRLRWNQYGYLMFKDFGDPNLHKALTMIEYVSHKYNIDSQAAVNKIAQDFGLVDGSSELSSISKRKKIKRELIETPSSLIINIKKRKYTDYDRDYWGQFYIPIEMLQRNHIHSISHVWYNRGFPIEFTEQYCAYSYDYYWHEGIFRRKIYSPNDANNKWYSNTDYSIVQNQPNIPKSGDLLFIQSSYKDCMSMELLGFWAVAPNKEGSWFTDIYWNKLKERYKKIIIMWDNDHFKEQNSGLLMAQKFSEMYGLPYIMTPSVDKITDISEFNRAYGLDSGRSLVMDLISKV